MSDEIWSQIMRADESEILMTFKSESGHPNKWSVRKKTRNPEFSADLKSDKEANKSVYPVLHIS